MGSRRRKTKSVTRRAMRTRVTVLDCAQQTGAAHQGTERTDLRYVRTDVITCLLVSTPQR